MTDRNNPYIAGAPVTEARMFFGREDVFTWIERSLPGRYVDHILVIHGQRRVGKTSVLKQLPKRLPDRYVPVFFDLQGRTRTTLDRFLWWLAREITRTLKQDRNIGVPMPPKGGFAQDAEYLETVFLPKVQATLGNQNLLLTFDEFDSLEEGEARNTLARPLIDKLAQLTSLEGLNFIFSIGSSGRKLENMQASYTEFFKAALYREISFLSAQDTQRLITQPVQGLLQYDQATTDRIHGITSGHPYFTQLICHELFSRHQETGERQIRLADVEAVLDDVVERGTVNLKFIWDEASDLEKWVLACLAQAEGRTNVGALAKTLENQRVRFAPHDLEASLLHLREKDVLTEDNRFVVQLLRIWLQKNRPLERVRQELIELNPIASRYIEIGMEYKSVEEHERALESFREALRVDAENIQAQIGIADVLLHQRDWQAAVVAYQKALSLDDEDVVAKTGICEAYLALGNQALEDSRPEEAVQSYQRVLAINGEHTEARQHMANIYGQRAERSEAGGRFDTALRQYRKALEYTPEDLVLETRYQRLVETHRERMLKSLLKAADTSIANRSWSQAVQALDDALQLAPEETSIQEKLRAARAEERAQKLRSLSAQAQVQTQAEDWDQAIHTWKEYLSMHPEDSEAAEAAIQGLQKEKEKHLTYAAAQKALAAKDYDHAVKLLKGIVFEDEGYRNAAKLLAQSIDAQRVSKPRITRRRVLGAAGIIASALLIFWLARPESILRTAIASLPQASPSPAQAAFPPTSPSGPPATGVPSAAPRPTATPDWREEFTSSIVWTTFGWSPDFHDDFSQDTLGQPPAWKLPADGIRVVDDTLRLRSDGEWTGIDLPAGAMDFALKVEITPYLVTSDYSVTFSFRGSDAGAYDLVLSSRGSSIQEWSLSLFDANSGASKTIAEGGGLDLLAGEKGNLLLTAVDDRVAIIAGTKALVRIEEAENFGEAISFGVKAAQGGSIEVAIDNVSFWNLEPQWMRAFVTPVLAAAREIPPNQEHTFTGNSSDQLLSAGDPDVSVEDERVMVRYEDRSDNFYQWSTNNFLLTFDFLPTLTTASSALVIDFKRPMEGATAVSYQFRLNLDSGKWELVRLGTPSSSSISLDDGALSGYARDRWAELGIMALGDQFSVLLDGRPLTHERDTARLDRATVDPPNELLLESNSGLTETAIDNVRLWDLNTSSIHALGQNWAEDLGPAVDSIEATDPTLTDDFSTANTEWRFHDPDFVVEAGQMKLRAIGSSAIYGEAGLMNAKDFMLQFDFTQGSRSSEGSFGMELRKGAVTDPKDQSYLLEIDLDTGGYSIRYSFSPDVAYHPEILSGRVSDFDFQRPNQLRIIAQGDQLGFYLNGLPMAYFSDQRVNGKTNAFFIASDGGDTAAEVLIDNFSFWRLDP